MSTTAGVFSETTLQNIRAKADERMFDSRIRLNYIPRIDILSTIPLLQTAKIGELSQKKDYTIELEWINNCAIVSRDCTSCEVGGTELSTNTEEKKITRCQEVPFTVKGYKMIDNDYSQQDIVANAMLTADKVLCEYIAQDYLAWLVANAGVNEFDVAGEIGTIVGNETQIAAANMTINAFAYILKVASYNSFVNAQNLSGNLLYNAFKVANFQSGIIADGAGVKEGFDQLNLHWDLYNFTLGGLNDRMLMVSQGAIAFASKSYFGPAVEDYGKEGKRWSMPSRFFPGLVLEVHYNTGCENDLINEDFNVKARYDFFLNPEGCRGDNNGILQFVQVQV